MGNGKDQDVGTTWPEGPKGLVSNRSFRRTLQTIRDNANNLVDAMDLELKKLDDEERAEEKEERQRAITHAQRRAYPNAPIGTDVPTKR